jgi:hypothetical protein
MTVSSMHRHVSKSEWKLVRAECLRCPWLLAETKVATILGIVFTTSLSLGKDVVNML